MMNLKSDNYVFIFHATNSNKDLIIDFIKKINLNNTQVISDENIKSKILSKSVFAVSKSGTVSLEICNAEVPSIIIYKINIINYFIMKLLVKVRFANVINIINDKEVLPELLQNECNAREIYNSVQYFLRNPESIKTQLDIVKKTLNNIRSETSSSEKSAIILSQYL
tara:strand:- start:16 stop:516 length:501 start_codon:yes stop_codon:yes gene_type:complete